MEPNHHEDEETMMRRLLTILIVQIGTIFGIFVGEMIFQIIVSQQNRRTSEAPLHEAKRSA
jgi:hypothetical protein